MYKESIENKEKYFDDQASEVYWDKKYSKVTFLQLTRLGAGFIQSTNV